MPSVKTGGYIPPVSVTGKRGKNIEGLDKAAAAVVDNPELIAAVIERVCKVDPGLVRRCLEKTDERLTAILTGGYVDRFSGR